MIDRHENTPARGSIAELEPWCWRLLGKLSEPTTETEKESWDARTSHLELCECIIEQRESERTASQTPHDHDRSRGRGDVAE